jgi:uncharacterized membrane-anchored protein
MPYTARIVYEDSNENEFDVLVAYSYTRGYPAFTPRGEYAPTDPPEPAEVSVNSLQVRPIHGRLSEWKEPNAELAKAIHKFLDEDNNYEYLVNEAEADTREWEADYENDSR